MIDIDQKQAQAALSEIIEALDGDTFNHLRYALEAVDAYIRQGKETKGGHQS
ncbi:hypothetical protein P4G57_11570 [Lacticaseibacillus paracasei]|jgi:hypothetical protein|uniref:Phage protein n=1 Tax=Lacticaseibacillus paracasei TaxID=1597 RepID=A0ABD7BWU4_LACPA|nr:hypothetical protein [Lacticaseibacillus paracasei]MDN5580916.1 hypothetical protein [Lactococcus raffinolactis]MDP4466812.1 hypothetical protein [Lacticaseibacillus paracasei]QOP57225.1 hypothetical protein HCJ88_15730 [Lacticaseibacillus paracasei]UWP78172.1 hypothetical protein KZR06_15525 [Lacticaseibacillus paracasei]UWY26190.1 hypothetical protein N4T21_15665 [Lacticaseibacillus paracasei]